MKTIQDLVGKLRERGIQNRARRRQVPEPQDYISAWLEDDVITNGGPVVKALVVVLRTPGCSWARTGVAQSNNPAQRSMVADGLATSKGMIRPGGCTMCGYINDCFGPELAVKPEDYIAQIQAAINKFKSKQIKFVKIFTSGSFLDDNELPAGVQERILELCDNLSLDALLFESRPEFVTPEKLEQITAKFQAQIILAMGLESANNRILKCAINKGFKFEDYCTAARLAKKVDISLKSYLLLKPPFISERDAIMDVLNSIKRLHEQKLTDCISINPVNIQKFTLVEHLFVRQNYRPPWLWSVLEVLNRGDELLSDSNIRLLSQPTAGGLRTGAHNCGKCDKQLLNIINKYSLDGNSKTIQSQYISCPCRDKWEDVLDFENIARTSIHTLPE
ncbi:archaeosine biosynthesis radical SAM protein RaSEA [[Eubacterium] cellulosolvens]